MNDAVQAALVSAGAALGSSALTLTGTRWFDHGRDKRHAKAAREATRRMLYVELLTATGAMLTNAAYLRSISDFMSQLGAPFNQMFRRAPKQPDLTEILDLFQEPMHRLMTAWANAYLVFDQAEIDAVNRLVTAATNLDLSEPPDDPKSGQGALGAARREFARFARTRLGEDVVRLEPEPEAPEQP